MEANIKNIGLIENASIEIDKLTIIAGENDVGKSTVGKFLYANIKSFGKISNEIATLFIEDGIQSLMMRIVETISDGDTNDLFSITNDDDNDDKISDLRDTIRWRDVPIKEKIKALKDSNLIDKEDSEIKELFAKIDEYLELEKKPKNLSEAIYQRIIRAEFLEDIDITDDIANKDISKWSDFDDVLFISQSNDYVDQRSKSIFPRRVIGNSVILSHSDDFMFRIYSKKEENPAEILIEKESYDKLNKLNKLISNMFKGEFSFNNRYREFTLKRNGQEYRSKNIANGIKTLGYFQQILTLNLINNNNLLILDEPETSLHPKWQVKFAEILIKLIKEFKMKIVVISHSPFFLETLHKISKKEQMGSHTNSYFLSRNENNLVIATCCNEDLNIIYNNLASAYDDLDRTLEDD